MDSGPEWHYIALEDIGVPLDLFDPDSYKLSE